MRETSLHFLPGIDQSLRPQAEQSRSRTSNSSRAKSVPVGHR